MVLPEVLSNTIERIPPQPGVYRLKDVHGGILYIGKSKNLNDRVRTYFQPYCPDRKLSHLRARTKHVDVLLMSSEQQAREAEWDLIRHYSPPYNTLYLDYWNRPYIKITRGDPYPRIELAPQKNDDENAEWFGPFSSTRHLRETLVGLRETFPIRNCDLSIKAGGQPEEHTACIERDLGRCSAPCIGEESVDSYRERLDGLRQFLNGQHKQVIERLRSRMQEHAKNHEYEAAAVYRDRVAAVESLVEYEPFLENILRTNVIAIHGDLGVIMTVREHRVKTFEFHQRDKTWHDTFGDMIQSVQTRGGEILVDDPGLFRAVPDELVGSPVLEEEQELLKLAKDTVRFEQQRISDGDTEVKLTDRILVKGSTLNKRRIVDGELEGETTLDPSDSMGPGKTIRGHYQGMLENGELLPTDVEIELVGNSSVSEDLFESCEFDLPLRINQTSAGEELTV